MAIGLAPMAVAPGWQRRGVGLRLVDEGLDRLRAAGHRAVVVLGHPEYYPRHGFSKASGFGLRWEHPARDEAFGFAQFAGMHHVDEVNLALERLGQRGGVGNDRIGGGRQIGWD